ncbi:hypothetical protein X732_27575 [Mesorhizobium sp. L2C066B000]|nr:hypothetical protein X732_27575 [Mesorhizobium sp. L2C066B000]
MLLTSGRAAETQTWASSLAFDDITWVKPGFMLVV